MCPGPCSPSPPFPISLSQFMQKAQLQQCAAAAKSETLHVKGMSTRAASAHAVAYSVHLHHIPFLPPDPWTVSSSARHKNGIPGD